MRNFKRNIVKISIISWVICIGNTVFAQQNTDANFIFKTLLFLDHKNFDSRYSKDFKIKDSSLFARFNTGVELNFDTLKTTGFSSEYNFFLLASYKGNLPYKTNAIRYNLKKQIEYVGIPVNNCDGYVICVNNITGISYRIQGFNSSDFLALIRDIQLEISTNDNKQLMDKEFLKMYSVNGIDFRCLYEGLKANPKNWYKYPCLNSCKYFVVIVH